ncbi:hypothetical protein GN958_ATG20380 [Phytophthora infestans]|uniref:Uncharacterized protein n=1 Tax=Phytophthora infestans TaxID=4787 RepID=A0A8S9TNJ2_PHYIN|nr:hypothetical protein GN958_ATG20380 [Phytophthora infestans]
METRFPQAITKVLGNNTVHASVSAYLLGINPTSWTVISNMKPSRDEQKWLKTSWKGVEAYVDAMPLLVFVLQVVWREPTMDYYGVVSEATRVQGLTSVLPSCGRRLQ